MSDDTYTPSIEEARKAWVSYRLDTGRFGRENFGRGDAIGEEFDRAIATLVAATREADAKIAEDFTSPLVPGVVFRSPQLKDVAAAIRAIGATDGTE